MADLTTVPSAEWAAETAQRVHDLEAGQTAIASRVNDHETRIQALEDEPVEPPPIDPPPGLELREPIVLDGISDQTLSDFAITLQPGDPRKWALILRDCHRITIDNYQIFGGGIHVVGGSDVEIRPGLVERNRAGDPEARDSESCVRFLGHERGSLYGSVLAYGDCIVRAEASSDIHLEGNFTYNPRGPKWRGQHFQTWYYEGTRSHRITIKDHYALTDFTHPGNFPGVRTFQEDAFNFGGALDTRLENVFSEMIGHEDGYGSASGTGLIFEGGTGRVEGFTSIGHANHGWSVSGGADVYIEEALSFFDGAGDDGFRPAGSGRTAGVCWNRGSHVEFGPNVRCYGDKSSSNPYGAYWLESGAATQTGNLADSGRYMDPAAVQARAELVRPEIPDVGFVIPS